jgi:uncharacterized membrane protein
MSAADPKQKTTQRDVVAVLTHRVLTMALEELRSEETRRYVSENLVVPLLKAVMVELMPYFIVFATIIAAILLMSALSLTLLAIFCFRPPR